MPTRKPSTEPRYDYKFQQSPYHHVQQKRADWDDIYAEHLLLQAVEDVGGLNKQLVIAMHLGSPFRTEWQSGEGRRYYNHLIALGSCRYRL